MAEGPSGPFTPLKMSTQNPEITLGHPQKHNPRTLGLKQDSPAHETKMKYQGKDNQKGGNRFEQINGKTRGSEGLGNSLPPSPDPPTLTNHNLSESKVIKQICNLPGNKALRAVGPEEPEPKNLPSIRVWTRNPPS